MNEYHDMSKQRLLGVLGALATLLVGCSDGKQSFVAEGHILGGEGQTLYLEETGTGQVLSLDSVKLSSDGRFHFEHEGTSYPMFYHLRLGGQTIPFCADSVTHLVVKAEANSLFETYELTEADQYNHQIREVAHLRHQTDMSIDSLLALYTSGIIEMEVARQGVDSLAGDLKRTLSQRFIYVDPKSPVAYFALFQRKGEGAYFSADEEGDERVFAAVATAYDLYYKEAPYTPFLKDMALRALARARARRSWAESGDKLADKISSSVSYPEIKLKGKQGQEHSLSHYAERGTVLLSFTAYQAQWSPMLVSSMRELQAKHPDWTIYEVSFDGDDYLWQNATRTLPWVTVHDPEGQSLVHYNVQQLPTFFLIRGGQLERLSSLPD